MPAATDCPSSIDLWHLNETYGIWIKTGVAFKNNLVYEFSVSHFSSYNLEVKVDSVDEINFTVKSDFSFLSNQELQVLVDDIPVMLIVTDSNGEFSLLGAPTGNYVLKPILCDADINSDSINITGNGSYEFNVPNFDNFTEGVGKNIRLSGSVMNCVNYYEESDYILMELFGDSNDSVTLISEISSNGSFNFKNTYCSIPFVGQEITVKINYEKDSYEKVLNFPISSIDENWFYLNEKIQLCTIPEGNSIVIDSELYDNIRRVLGFNDNQTISVEYAKQIESLGFCGNEFGDGTLNFNEIVHNFPNLKTLSGLYYEEITNFNSISDLRNLEEFCMEGSSGSAILDISPLSGLVNLKKLNLMNNNISDLSPLFNLTNLTYLSLDNNPLTESQVNELRNALPNTVIRF